MPSYKLLQIDAFTDQPLSGNPCAVLLNTDDMDDKTMLAIAKEMNLSETAFVRKSKVADYSVRYFTPAEEIPLAGHPTIATTFALIDSGCIQIDKEIKSIYLELSVGPIKVEIHSDQSGVRQIMMSQMKPKFLAKYHPSEVMPIFGLSPKDVLTGFPIQTISTGTPQLMLPVRDHEVLRRVQLDIPAYTELRNRSDFFSPHLFCLEGINPEGDTFARHFGVPPDTMEDPFTGSATGGMGAYLWHYRLIDQPVFSAHQGHWMERPGSASVEVVGPRNDIETVKVGGNAVTVFRGTLDI